MTIRAYLEADHRRLDTLLKQALGELPNTEAYDAFRQGILQHIGIEETLLLAETKKHSGVPVERAEKLRRDHGAIAALLVLEPSAKVIHALEVIFQEHNRIEEGLGGVYEECEEILGSDAETLLEKIRQFPPVPIANRIQSEQLWSAARRCIERAGFSGSLLD